jgi:hypothetical protein
MQLSRSGAFVGGVVVAVVVGGGTAVASGGTSVMFGHGNVGKAATGLTNTAGTPLSLVAKKGAPALKVSNTVKVKNLNSDLLDGKDSTSFLASTGKAADSWLLGGQPASAFLGAGATAADSAKLGGLPASNYQSTVYSAATDITNPLSLTPPSLAIFDTLTLPPGTWSLSLTVALENLDMKIGQFGCGVAFTGSGVVTPGAEVDVMAASAADNAPSANLAAGKVVSLTQSTPLSVFCQSNGDDPARGKILFSNLTATRVTDAHGAVTVVN